MRGQKNIKTLIVTNMTKLMNTLHICTQKKVYILYSHVCLGLPSEFFPPSLSTEVCANCSRPIRAARFHLVLFLCVEHSKKIWWISSFSYYHSTFLCCLPHLSSILFPHTLKVYVFRGNYFTSSHMVK